MSTAQEKTQTRRDISLQKEYGRLPKTKNQRKRTEEVKKTKFVAFATEKMMQTVTIDIDEVYIERVILNFWLGL